MRWSKLKELIERNFATSVAGRVELHSTHYRGAHDQMGRAWLTIDKKEVFSFCTLTEIRRSALLATELREINRCLDFRDPSQSQAYYSAGYQATALLQRQGIYSQGDFYVAIHKYLAMPVEEALQSDNEIIRSLAILDRRVGKRRLRQLASNETDHPLMKLVLAFRCTAEKLNIGQQQSDHR